jgi:hypothetical protein
MRVRLTALACAVQVQPVGWPAQGKFVRARDRRQFARRGHGGGQVENLPIDGMDRGQREETARGGIAKQPAMLTVAHICNCVCAVRL